LPTVPRLTIGLPVYNGEQLLPGALESILGQTFGDFELLIGDNASTDGTGELCRAAAASDPRVRHLRAEENRGLAWNWNRLVHEARGSLFRWAAHDDLLAPTNLEHCVDALDADGEAVVLAYPRTTNIDRDGTVLGPYDDDMDLREATAHERLHHLLWRMERCNPLFGVMRTDALRSTRLMGSYGHADRVLLGAMCLQGQFHEVPEALFLRRLEEGMSPSLHNHRTVGELARLYGSRRTGRLALPRAQVAAELLRAIARADLPLAERARCLRVLAGHRRPWRAVAGARRAGGLPPGSGGASCAAGTPLSD
jgi:glycosyltransferase involved in cell wall biosynthesis